MYSICPKCGHQRGESDVRSEKVCPACGLHYGKWLKQRYRSQKSHSSRRKKRVDSLRTRAIATALTPRDDGRWEWSGRVLVWVLLLGLGFAMAITRYEAVVTGDVLAPVAFLHRINLVFHEAGHAIFIMFGDFLTVLGGSLMQVLIPLLVSIAFLVKRRDPFGASVGLWWLGQSAVDLAPYIADARALRLPLLGGGTGADTTGIHDWENILSRLDWLEYDRLLGGIAHISGVAMMVLALVWGAILLLLQHRLLQRSQ